MGGRGFSLFGRRCGVRLRRRVAASGQGGFTLVELLVGLAISALIVAVSVTALSVTRRSNEQGSENLTSSASAFFTGSRLADDVESVGPVASVTELISSGQPGCGGAVSVLRLIGPRSDGAGVQVRSYNVGTDDGQAVLRRATCSGTDLAAALAAGASRSQVVRDLASSPGAVKVTCEGSTVVDSNCRVVRMTVRTVTGRTFTVRGSVESVLDPTPTTAPAPPVAPVSGTCTIMATETTYGVGGALASGTNVNHGGEPKMHTYQQGAVDVGIRNYSYLKFDLHQPCVGPSDSWPTLPGGRNLTGATLYLAYLGKEGCCISWDEHVLRPLAADSIWSESTLTGDNMPRAAYSGYDVRFKVGNAGALTGHGDSAVTNTVKKWYQAGGWPNNGWILKRETGGDTSGKTSVFATRSYSDTGLRPRLVITWGP